MDDIKLILEVEKFRELYDPQHQFYKDNLKKDTCWDAVGAAVGSTSKFAKCIYCAIFFFQCRFTHIYVYCPEN